jgi:DNA replication protein DnaC
MNKTTCAASPQDDGLESLARLLRSLKLAGIADELRDLLESSAREQWGTIELLEELFCREEVRKRGRRFERNLKASGLSECYGIDHFDFDIAREHGVEASVVRDLVQCEFVTARRNLILAGGVGTGKTFLSRTLGVEALKRDFKVFSFYTAELVDLLHSKRSSFQFGKIYGHIRDVDLLILDDLAYLPYSPEKVEFLFSLVVDRYELKKGSTIVTSNTDVEDWWQFFPSKAMGMAFSDRLLHGAQGIRFSGESIRKPRRRPPAKHSPSPSGKSKESSKKGKNKR